VKVGAKQWACIGGSACDLKDYSNCAVITFPKPPTDADCATGELLSLDEEEEEDIYHGILEPIKSMRFKPESFDWPEKGSAIGNWAKDIIEVSQSRGWVTLEAPYKKGFLDTGGLKGTGILLQGVQEYSEKGKLHEAVVVQKLVPGGDLVDIVFKSHKAAFEQYQKDKIEQYMKKSMRDGTTKFARLKQAQKVNTAEQKKWQQEDIDDLELIVAKYENGAGACLPQSCDWDASNDITGSFCEWPFVPLRKHCEDLWWQDGIKKQMKFAARWMALFKYLDPETEKPLLYGQSFFLRFLDCEQPPKKAILSLKDAGKKVVDNTKDEAAQKAKQEATPLLDAVADETALNLKNCYLTSLGNVASEQKPMTVGSKRVAPGSMQLAYFEPHDPLNEKKFVRFGDQAYLKIKHAQRKLVVEFDPSDQKAPHTKPGSLKAFDPSKGHQDEMARVAIEPDDPKNMGRPVHRDDRLAILFQKANHYLTRKVDKTEVVVNSATQASTESHTQHMAIEF
jgi:hypothetical protein